MVLIDIVVDIPIHRVRAFKYNIHTSNDASQGKYFSIS